MPLHYPHSIRFGPGLEKTFHTNGILREELLDRDRDGKFDEKLSFDVYGVEVNREKLN